MDLFIKSGIDRLSVIVSMGRTTLKEIDVNKLGHCLLILDEIYGKIKQNTMKNCPTISW